MLLHQLYLKIPPSARENLKKILRSNGHSNSIMDPLTARKDALGKKRLDQSLHHLVEILGCEGARLVSGRICVEFGAGYVPTDAISMWLLGARSVTAVDYNAIARLRALHLGLAKADFAAVRRLLGDVNPDYDWNARLVRLERIGASRYQPSFLDGIPFRYIAPLDVIANPQALPAFDFLWSTSVLEHIAPSKLMGVLGALGTRANPGSVQVHRVDLRDHRDFDRAPYGFLDPKASFDPEAQADARGNAMTLGAWESELLSHPEWGLCIAATEQGRADLVPTDPETGNPVISRVADYVTIATSHLEF